MCVSFSSSRPPHRWYVGEVCRIHSSMFGLGQPDVEVVNHTTGQKETIPRDSQRIYPPMTKSATPVQTNPQNNANTRAQTQSHAAKPTIAAATNVGPTHAALPVSSSAHAPTGAPAAVEGVSVSALGLNDPSLISGHGRSLRVGDLIDCLDTESKWRLAEIVGQDTTQVLVHYVHWSNKWDAWISRNDKRLQPPRTQTEGYTGPANKRPLEDGITATTSAHTNAGTRPTTAPASVAPPQPPPRPSYTCLAACSWKRVLSTGLSHKEIQALNEIFAQCAYVQDAYEEVMMVSCTRHLSRARSACVCVSCANLSLPFPLVLLCVCLCRVSPPAASARPTIAPMAATGPLRLSSSTH